MAEKIRSIIDRGAATARLTKGELTALLACSGKDRAYLRTAADQVRREQVGDQVHLRGLIEFSNYCERDCLYCGLRRSNTNLARYRMTKDEILAVAARGVGLGYKTVVLQSGEDPHYTGPILAGIIRDLKKLGVAVTLSVGERPVEDYLLWREAGADRYLLKQETANPALYARLHPGMEWEQRHRCLLQLRELGYQVGAGSMVGLPGQTREDLAADLLFLQELDVEMAGIGPFIPHPATPLGRFPGGNPELVLVMVALARLLLPQAHLPATTALGTSHPQGRQLALQGGANVVMPDLTPLHYRRLYEIYPNKLCLEDKPEHCRSCIGGIISSLGRTIATDAGHSPKPGFRPGADKSKPPPVCQEKKEAVPHGIPG